MGFFKRLRGNKSEQTLAKAQAGGAGSSGGGGRPKRRWYWRLTFFLLRWGAIASVTGAALLAALVAGYSYFADDPLKAGFGNSTAKLTILADDGRVIAEKGMRRNHVPLEKMPQHLIDAVLATEDRRFYSHFGVDPRGILRAMIANRRAGAWVQGGSTITQQLTKVLFLTPDRTLRRKLEELLLALSLEYRLDKKQILELYLNRIYFGRGNYGVAAAAQSYFGKPVSDLTIYESAILAGLIKAPNYYAPTRHMERALKRGRVVLKGMLSVGFITQAQYNEALANPPTLRAYLPSESYGYVIDLVVQRVGEYGLNSQIDMVVETTINYEMQGVAQKIVSDNMDQHGKKYSAGEAAAIILDTNGAVKALVGGRDYKKSQYNHAVTAKRQPGSTFKPFVWLTALELGMTPNSTVYDGPLQIGDWSPSNYNNRYHGDVTLRQGLAFSLNTVAVRLSEWAGRDNVIKTAHRLGIASKLQQNASIALGTSEVSLWEITSAYVPFANGGYSARPHIIKSVRNSHGQTLYSVGRTDWGRVIRSKHVAQMNDMLMTTIETGTGQKGSLTPHQAAGKTGTTQSYRDAWFIGFTGHYVTGVWIGNDDNSPMKRVTGGGLPTMIWHDLMLYAHVNKQPVMLPGGDRRERDSGGDIVAGGRSLFDSGIRQAAHRTSAAPAGNAPPVRKHGLKNCSNSFFGKCGGEV
ncbi:MAG: PBP1A family penicillin-binding protein [Alphaproteobacteria bacterium]